MQELSMNKKMRIIKLYLDGFSYDEIAKKVPLFGALTNIQHVTILRQMKSAY